MPPNSRLWTPAYDSIMNTQSKMSTGACLSRKMGIWRMNTVLPHPSQLPSLFPQKSCVGRNFIAGRFLAMFINEPRCGVRKVGISGHAG